MMKHSRGIYILNALLALTLLLLTLCTFYLSQKEASASISFTTDTPSISPSTLALSEADQKISAYAASHGLRAEDYPQSLSDLLARNPETEQFVLEYPTASLDVWTGNLSEYGTDTVPLLMQWDQRWGYRQYGENYAALTACGPVCLSMAAYYLTGDAELTPVYMMDFAEENGYCVTGDGTSWTLFSEGAQMLGLDVTEIPLDEDRILDNLEAGNPIICAMGPGDFTTSGHYIVMVGCSGVMIQINDPNSYANSQKMWRYEDIASQIENLWVLR